MAIFTAGIAAISAVAASVSAFMVSIGPVAAFLLKTAVGIGVNLLLSAISGKPKAPSISINGQLQSGGDLPRRFIIGEYMTAGSLVYANTWGKEKETDNAYLTQVMALSDIPVTSFTTLWTNSEETPLFVTEAVQSAGDGNALGLLVLDAFKSTFGILDDFLFRVGREAVGDKLSFIFDWLEDAIVSDGGTPVVNVEQSEQGFPIPAYKKDDKNNLWIKFYDGNQTTADSFLTNRVANAKRPWESTRVGKGVAYAIVTARVAGNMFSGIPNFKFVIRGIPLYDISKDSTAGGDGDHRLDDPDTWGGDGDLNPAVQAYNILMGIYYDNEWFYGLQGMNASRLPPVNWIAAINKCREPIEGEDGPEPTYRCSGEITVDTQIGDVLDMICTACAGRITEEGGIYRMFVGTPEDPSFHIHDGNILSTAVQEFTPFYGLSDLVNGVHANYPSPEDGWEMASAPPLFRTDLRAKHGNRKLMADIDLVFVPYAEQVQRLMASTIKEAERARRHTFKLPPAYWAFCVPGATFTWTSERNGYTTKLFRIDGVMDEPNLDVTIDCTEVDPADYSWDTDTDYVPPVIPPTGPVRPTPQPIEDFFVEPATVLGSGSKMRPAIKLTWDPNLADIRGIQWQVRNESTAEIVNESQTENYSVGSIKVSNGLFSVTDYEVRAKYIPITERDTLWSGWFNVTTPNVQYTDVAVTIENASDDFKAVLQDLRDLNAGLTSRVKSLALSVIEGTRQATHANSIAVKDGEAFAAALTEMDASIEGIDDELVAQASILDAVIAVVGDVESGVLWRMEALAGSGDVEARASLQVRASIADDYIDSGLILEAGFIGGDPGQPFSRVMLYGQQVVVADHLGNVSALFDSDGVTINNAFIQELEAVNIKARSIIGDRIVVLGVDTPELALDSVTYIDSVVTTTPLATVSNTWVTGEIVMVDDYVSGGILGAFNCIFDTGSVAALAIYNFRIVRSTDSALSSPVVVGGDFVPAANTMPNNILLNKCIAMSDVPPSAGDWYYGFQFNWVGTNDSNGIREQSITVSHAKR